MGLARFALRNPYLIIVAILIVALMGAVSWIRIPTDLLPVFKAPAVQIVTFYPGMPAEVMERDITSRLERWTGQSNGVALQESKSMVGVSIVKDYFRSDIDPNTAMSQVTSLAMSDLFYLPPGTIPPMVMPFDPTASVPLCLLAVSSETFDETKLYDVAYFDLRNRLQGIPGVIAPAVYGGKLRRILAYVDPMKLQARNLSPVDVVNGIRRQNVMIPTGNAKFGDYDVQVDAQGMLPTVPDLDGIPIKTVNGVSVLLRDVARAEDVAQIQTNIVRINGRRQVYIPIYRQPGANTIGVVDSVKATLGDILKRLPEGINLDVVIDQSLYVRKAIGALVTEGGLGALLAGLTVLLFLGSLRSTGLITFAIPISILAAIIGLLATGNTLNAMTLGGLALVVGRLVDDSIVVLENIERHRALGKDSRLAALDGTAEVALPVLASTITTLIVFLPIVFLSGISRFLFAPLALAVTLSMAASYLFAMTVVPIAEARRGFRRPESREAEPRREAIFTRLFHRVADLYARTVRPLMRRPAIVILAALAILAATALLASLLGRELFPVVDTGSFTILVRAPSGLRVEKTEQLMAEVEGELRRVVPEKDIKLLITNIGVLNDWPAAYTPNSGPGDAFLAVQMTEHRSRTAADTADLLRRRLPARFPGIEFSYETGGLLTAALNGGLPSPIDVQIEGNQLETAVEVARRIEAELKTIRGAVDVRIRQRLDAPQVGIQLDRIKAAEVGLTAEDVVKNLVTALNSSINFAPSFWIDPKNGNHYFIGAQYREEAIESFETLENLPITGGGSSRPVLLKNIATLERRTAPDAIYHRNITRVVDIFANVRGRDVGSVASELEKRIARIEAEGGVPKGYFVRMRGEVASFRESLAGLAFGLVLAAILVYLVLVAQFSSFVEPLLILIAVPLGGIGVVGMMLLTRTALSIPAMLGAIFLIGIAVSNSILLVEFAGRLRRQGQSAADAIIEAGRIRLRPIAMTTIAAVLGLVPMAVSSESVNAPLARVVIGGLLVSGLLTLYLLPPIYALLPRSGMPLPAKAMGRPGATPQ